MNGSPSSQRFIGGQDVRQHRAARAAAAALVAIGLHAGGVQAASLTGAHVATIDDATTGRALFGHFDYIGNWQVVRGKHDGRSYGTSTRSTRAGDVALIHFRGTRIRLYGVRGPSGGRAGIALDLISTGKPVDFYAPGLQAHSLIYESPELSNGDHTLSIVVWGLRDEGARFYYVNIDDAQIETPSELGRR